MDTVNDRIRYSEHFHGVLWVPEWGILDARMDPVRLTSGTKRPHRYCWYSHRVLCGSRWHIQRTHAAHSQARARKARARVPVRMSVHCEPLPSCSGASLAPHSAALGFEFAAARLEYCADSASSEAAYLRFAGGTDGCMLSSIALLRGTCVLRSPRQS